MKRLSLSLSLLALLGGPQLLLAPALAQSPAAPAAPTAAVPPTPQLPAVPLATERKDWRAANESVGEFARGHIDILRWEAAQAGKAGAPAESLPALSEAEALRRSLLHRPELFVTPGAGALDQARTRIAYVTHARDLRKAWIDAVAAGERARLAAQSLQAAEAGALLGAEMAAVGNWSEARKLDTQRTLAEYANRLLLADQAAYRATEHLRRLIGASEDSARFSLPSSLPPPPPTPRSAAAVEEQAVDNHPTLALRRIELARQRAEVGEARLQIVRDAMAAALDDSAPGAALTEEGFAPLPVEPPTLDRRDLLQEHASQQVVASTAEVHALAVRVRSQAREAYRAYRVRHAIALEHGTRLLPIAEALEQDMLLRYNGMLESTWTLLDSARARLAAADAAIEARRALWRADADLQAVLAGADYPGPDGDSSAATDTPTRGGH